MRCAREDQDRLPPEDRIGQPPLTRVVLPGHAFDHRGKARALGTMLKALAKTKAAGLDGKAVTNAPTLMDWAN